MASKELDSRLTRREFGTLVTGALIAGAPHGARGQTRAAAGERSGGTLDIADWSYFWYGVEHAHLARGTFCNGAQMYVEHWVPSRVRHPYPVVLVHGGYGQGTDWLSTPDGRRGWVSHLVEQGYKVYVVDRPGQGRNPYHPWVHGAFDARAPTFERTASVVGTQPRTATLHTQWPGSGDANDPAIAQVVASMGQPMGHNAITHDVWRTRGVLLLDDIGPSVLVTHDDGSYLAWLTAMERPNLVKGIVTLGQVNMGPTGQTREWLTDRFAGVPFAIVTDEVSQASDGPADVPAMLRQIGLRVDHIRLTDRGVRGNGPMPMVEKNNREVLQVVLDWMRDTVETSRPGAPAIVTSGVDPNRSRESTAVKLADQGGFWVGVTRKAMPYGTIAQGQMFAQYMIPADQRYPYPIVMVHGGGAQGTHMMGLGRRPGWVHYFVQAGYSVYWLDRPSYGRSPYHPDALGPSHLPNVPPYEPLIEATNVFKTAQWPGPGGMHDPFIDQFMACESGNTTDEAFHSDLVWPGGAELVDRIGPCILHGHAFGGFFGWGVADRRPALVKGIVCMEINGNPFERQLRWGLTAGPMTYEPPVTDPTQFTLIDRASPPDSPRPVAVSYTLQAEPARRWKNLKGIPIAWLTSEFGAGGSPVANVEFLKQVGCSVEMVRLRDHGIFGNGNLMLMERNNHDVFTVLRDWLDTHVAAPSR